MQRGGAADGAMVVDTLGGRMHVHRDDTAQATPNGQLAFFAEFLTGHRRYAHVAAQALGVQHIDEATNAAWLRPALMSSVSVATQ